MRASPAILALLSSLSQAPAITIELDYSLDTNGFFDHQERRDVLRAAADFYEGVITNSLSAIIPAGLNTWQLEFAHPGTNLPTTVVNPTIPADTLRIYAGGFAIPGVSVGIGGPGGWDAVGISPEWLDTIDRRGAPDGGTTTGTQFTPWGGTVAFDTTVDWNYSLTTPSATQIDFVSIALHEIAHVLGLGTAGAWDNLVNFDTGTFDGPQCMTRYGGGVPIESNLGHFRDDDHCSEASPGGFDPANWRNVLSSTLAMFGTPAGLAQIVNMDPSSCSVGTHIKVVTEVDLAALDDIGWDIVYPPIAPAPLPALSTSIDPNTGHVTISFPSAAPHTYQFQQSQDLITWVSTGPLIDGDGSTQSLTDTNPPTGLNHYRLLLDPPVASQLLIPAPRVAPAPSPLPGLLPLLTASRPPHTCTNCSAHTSK